MISAMIAFVTMTLLSPPAQVCVVLALYTPLAIRYFHCRPVAAAPEDDANKGDEAGAPDEEAGRAGAGCAAEGEADSARAPGPERGSSSSH